MKTKKNNTMAMQLPGALALAAAGAATQANAATVQITFNGSYISTTGGNHLVTDFGGDTSADINGFAGTTAGGVFAVVGDSTRGGLGQARGGYNPTPFASGFILGVVGGIPYATFIGGATSASATLRAWAEVTFSDDNIRGGLVTKGYLDLTTFANQPGEKRVTVNRLIFDVDTGGTIGGLNVLSTYTPYEISAVPEASTSLGLLALGAGGLLTRRRQKRAAQSV